MDLLKNLAKWQAASSPELARHKPEELFRADFAERYTRLHHDLWQRITRLHGTLMTLEQLEGFPFDYLYGPNEGVFWRLVIDNFFDMTSILLHGLVNDNVPHAHTVRTFKNEISNQVQWRDQAKLDVFRKTLRERKFDRSEEDVAKRVRAFRNNLAAHRLVDKQRGAIKRELDGVSLKELRQLFDATHALFGALSFGSAYMTLAGDLIPGTIGGTPTRKCLDEVLDAVLRGSDFVNKPERRGQWWPLEREHIDPERVRIMNDCRRRVGLPVA